MMTMLKTTSKQHDGAILTFDVVNDDPRSGYPELALIKVMLGDYCIASYYLGTIMEWGNTRGWCVTRSRWEPYRAVSNNDAEALIAEALEIYPNDPENYAARFTYHRSA